MLSLEKYFLGLRPIRYKLVVAAVLVLGLALLWVVNFANLSNDQPSQTSSDGVAISTTAQSEAAAATSTATPTYDALDQEHISKLAAIRPGCAERYKTILSHTFKDSFDQSNFTVLRPLTYYTCGEFSDITTMPLADGKTIYFVVTDFPTDCGSGGCWYSAFLEEKPGLVKQLRGFDGYSLDYQINHDEPTLSSDPSGQVFGALSVKKTSDIVRVKEGLWCGPYMENVYQIINDLPTLIASYEYKNDGCIGAPPTTIFRNTKISKSLTAPGR